MKNLSFKLNKSTIGYHLILIIFFVYFFHRFLIEVGLSEGFKYMLDVLNVILFIYALSRKSKKNKAIFYLIICYGCVVAIGTISTIVNLKTWGFNLSYYIFDCRLFLRLPMFYYSCSTLLKEDDVEKLFTWFLRFHVLNSIYIIYQYFTLEVPIYWMRGDNLNGFFGTATGGNIYVNVLLIATIIIALNRYVNGTYSRKKIIYLVVLNLLVAVLIELKFFFVEMIFLVFMYAIPYIKKPTKKQFVIGVVVVLGSIPLFMGLTHLLYKIYPWMDGTISISTLIKLASSSEGYTGIGDINRLSVIPDVMKLIYYKDWTDAVLGIGLGTASVSGETAPFYTQFFSTHYSWLSSAYVFIEVGIIGLLSYTVSLIVPFICIEKNTKYYAVTQTICVMSVILMIYNESLKTEAGYIIFFMMATGFISTKLKGR